MTDTRSLESLREHLPRLLAAISATEPTGHSLRDSREIDHLREARREDDASLPMGVWEHDHKRSDWHKVEAIASELLANRSKDLMVAAWLGEAWLHQYRLAGLCAALELLTGLCERYDTDLYPRSGDLDPGWLAAPLNWAVRKYSELLNVRIPMLDVQLRQGEPLIHAQWLRARTLTHVTGDNQRVQAEAEGNLREWTEAILKVPANEIAMQVSMLTTCLTTLERLNGWSDRHLGDEAPSFMPLRNALQQQLQTQQGFLAMHPEATPLPDTLLPDNQAVASITAQAAAAPDKPAEPHALPYPTSREAAYQQLRLIADYLAQIEPHSPVPYLINRGIEWGNKPLHELLAELTHADVDTRRIWSALGILP